MGENEEKVLYAVYIAFEKNKRSRMKEFFECLKMGRPMVRDSRKWLLDNHYCELEGNLSIPTKKGFDYVKENKLWDKFCDLDLR